MAAPVLDQISPAAARGGASVTLTGSGFGARDPNVSAVHFRLPDPAAPAVSGTIDEWKADTIRARVPALASFGSGGPLAVTVHTPEGDSTPKDFLLLEDGPPILSAVEPARGLEQQTVTLTGQRFGRPHAGASVLFDAGPTDVRAEVTSWAPTSIQARVPALASLGGAGVRPVRVVTGPDLASEPRDFLVGELPSITGVAPPSPSPGHNLVVNGHAFGPRAGGRLRLISVFDPEDQLPEHTIEPEITHWDDEEIHVRLPDLRELRRTGPKDIEVETEWGRGARRRILVNTRASVTSWTRVEPHARTTDLQEGLRLGLQAPVYDALWLLGRQWQLLEFKGADGGSPIRVDVDGAAAPLARWQPRGGEAADIPPGVPLETLVERERVLPPRGGGPAPFGDLRLAVEAGMQFLRHLAVRVADEQRLDKYRGAYLKEYALDAPPGAELDGASRRFVSVMDGRVLDGQRLYADLQVALPPAPELPKKPPIAKPDEPAVLAAIADWFGWCEGVFSQAQPGESAWDRERMEYGFSAVAGETVVDAPEHDGGHLDWYSFVRADGDRLGDAGSAVAFERSAIPSPVSYPGMPLPRWWQLENAAVDFGAVAAAPTELLKLVLVEFATVFGNDWFEVPLDSLPTGSLVRIASVVVTDTFGEQVALTPFGDGAASDWRMFELAARDGSADAGDVLLLLDALPTTLESVPAEDVLLLRDELANLAWAVERVVESPTGRPLDRHEQEVVSAPPSEPPSAQAMRRYELQSPVPRNWIPLLPKQVRDDQGRVLERRLARGRMRDRAGGPPIEPLGELLAGEALELFDEEVPRAGARVVRVWQLARAADGSTHLWRARRKGAGRGEGSSGLRFDRAERR